MKKTYYYFLAMLALSLSACQKQPIVPEPALVKPNVQALTITLAPSDYQTLPSTTYPHTSLYFKSASDANLYIPMILNSEEPSALGNGSTASVTYSLAPASLTVPDSLPVTSSAPYSYTLTTADYALLPGNKFADFSIAQVLSWLPYKYPNPVANQLEVLTFAYFNSSISKSAVTSTFSFLYLNGAWKKIYNISAAQYTAVGEGRFDQFGTADNLIGDFNVFLKSDVTIADTAKAGDVEYVSYDYFASNDTAYQKVQALTFDGNNWGAITTTATGSFLKSNGTWAAVKPVPTITFELTGSADLPSYSNPAVKGTDIYLIANSGTATGASSAVLSNLSMYGDFETAWTTAELDAAFILVLTNDYPNPQTGYNYVVKYDAYINKADVLTPLIFHYNGTAFVAGSL